MAHIRMVPGTAPRFWLLWLSAHLGCPADVAQKLWGSFLRVATPQQIFLMRQAEEQPGSVIAMLRAIPPGTLLSLTEQLAPVDGRPRQREIVALEERILQRTGESGRWR